MPKDKPYIEEEEGKEEGDFDADVYTEEGREQLVEDDEITDVEEGFAEGYEHGETEVKCQNCGKMITDVAVERSFRGREYFFCSISCAESYMKKVKIV